MYVFKVGNKVALSSIYIRIIHMLCTQHWCFITFKIFIFRSPLVLILSNAIVCRQSSLDVRLHLHIENNWADRVKNYNYDPHPHSKGVKSERQIDNCYLYVLRIYKTKLIK